MRVRAFLLMFLGGALAAVAPACVVHTRAPLDAAAEARAGRDFSGTEARVLLALNATRDEAARKRLSAVHTLLDAARDWPAEQRTAVLDFVNGFLDNQPDGAAGELGAPQVSARTAGEVAVEEPGSADGAVAPPVREEAPVALPEGASQSDLPPVASPDPRVAWESAVARARTALAENHPALAMQELATVPDLGQIDGGRELGREAQDAFVRDERERAAQLFLQAREIKDPAEKRVVLEQARDLLAGLLKTYPNSAYASAISKNLERVRKELAGLPGAHP
jgi:hypothetical protein